MQPRLPPGPLILGPVLETGRPPTVRGPAVARRAGDRPSDRHTGGHPHPLLRPSLSRSGRERQASSWRWPLRPELSPRPCLGSRGAVLASGFRLRLARRRRSNEKVPLTWKNRTCLGTYQPRVEGTFPVKNSARTARVMVSADGRGLVSQAGAVLLWETMRVTGLGRGLSTGLDRWRAPRATSPPREELSRNSVHLDEAGPRPRGTSSQGRLNELTECQT